MSSFKPHLEVLPETQKETWPTLGWTTTNRFVLYGGTAIALRCGHRASIDFDFFTDQPLNQSTILQELPKSAVAFRVVQKEKNSLTVVSETGNVRAVILRWPWDGASRRAGIDGRRGRVGCIIS
ncbi:MAG: nucleotidyl transferase AbiEii/AbiGii toxin family protein [Spirochaetia bacterium]|jgi:hypothetical protein